MDIGVSIIICTYNGKNRLSDTLKAISSQDVTIPCEIILIDNASNDGTKEFADLWWLNNGSDHITYQSFTQPIPGKSYAQEMAYDKAKFEFLLICDDDNWLNSNYVQTAYEIMISNNQIGALGGWCEAIFEDTKPTWFDKYSNYFAVSKQGTESGDITNQKGCLYGAGMVVRKSHWLYLRKLGFKPLLTCRKGDTLASGGDTEYSNVLRLLGYRIWYDERLYFKHYMPSGRMNIDYLIRIRKAISESNFVIKAYKDKLVNDFKSKNSFKKLFFRKVRLHLFRNLIKKYIGNFEQKENAKEYFRSLRKLFFAYEAYKQNYESINTWFSKHKV